MIIQPAPKRSVTIPKQAEKNVLSRGISMVCFCAKHAKALSFAWAFPPSQNRPTVSGLLYTTPQPGRNRHGNGKFFR
ncbi:MAG: hypothetical protein ACLFQT_11850, partial [Thiohalophilus sp.]